MEINDLTKLMEIDENDIINILNERYKNDVIYTNIDDILIAINPYKKLSIYNYENFKSPHVYNIAKNAISNLQNTNKNQTILISGRSGAGKTTNTKLIINYFAHNFSVDSNLCSQIINSNPIIEVFGNAITSINDNSSRFGKFIKIYFNEEISSISGIQIDTYLLEKSRVCYQNEKDFNFHIFNQVAANKNSSFKYCNPRNTDPNLLNKTINIMKKFGFNIHEINSIINIINLILMIGDYDNGKLMDWSKYTDLNMVELLSTRIIKAGDEEIKKKIEGEEMEKNKFSIGIQLYEITFNYIINKINKILNPNSVKNNFIGLLDIFGFEIFEKNNFEQMCINYTNEKLQNHHNNIIFKHEQELYKKEEINWSIIHYKDNRNIIDIFENKMGIINLLDEECKLIHSSDNNFHQKMKNFIKSSNLNINIKPKFTIHHYAGIVDYSSRNFCEKNKQRITSQLISFIKKSNNIIFQDCKFKHKEKSIIKSFSKELNLLMSKIKETRSLFIKCIKPNNLQTSDNFQSSLIHKQLLFSGIFETIQITRENYPIRYPLSEYYQKYNYIMNDKYICGNEFTEKDIQFGNTIVFLRTETYLFLEKTLLYYKNLCAITIQKNWKQYYIKSRYLKLKISTVKIQSLIRMYYAKKKYIKKRKSCIFVQSLRRMVRIRKKFIEKRKKSMLIQSYIRMNVDRNKYVNLRKSCILIQSIIRMKLIRKKYLKLRYQVIFFQHLWKQYKKRKEESFWPKSSQDSPSIFFVMEQDLIIEDILLESDSFDEKEVEILKIEYENKIEELKSKYHHQKLKKKEIQQKLHNKLIKYEQEKISLNKDLNYKEETNRLLMGRLNNLLVANYQLQQKVHEERKKGVFNKIYEFLFT